MTLSQPQNNMEVVTVNVEKKIITAETYKVYISGPHTIINGITGELESNEKQFKAAELFYNTIHHYEVFLSPYDESMDRGDRFHIGLQRMLACNEVVFLPGWEKSEISMWEQAVASRCPRIKQSILVPLKQRIITSLRQ